MLTTFRSYFASRSDPYAGGDLDNAQRIGSGLFGLQVLLMLALVPLSPPTHPIGGAGWLVAGAVILAGLAVTLGMWHRRLQSWAVLLAAAYAAVVALEVMQWLGGGTEAPYDRAILLPVIFVAAIQPPRRIAGFLGFVGLALAVPFLYGGVNPQAAGGSASAFVVLAGLSLGVNILFMGIRAQRLAHARDEAARIDSLTGLRNRRAFDEELANEANRARRLEIPLSIAMVDIVNFKDINDQWSPAEGDRCLREIAETLQSVSRGPDHCFRWGGDEFAIILSGTGAEDGQIFGDRARTVVSSSCKRPDDEPVRIRFAVAELRDSDTAEELVEMVGLAMTAAKLQDVTGFAPELIGARRIW
jgi:diguanylate cyclase (GGDEF)-like protein